MTDAKTLATQIDQGDFSMSDLQQAAVLLRQQASEVERLKQEQAKSDDEMAPHDQNWKHGEEL